MVQDNELSPPKERTKRAYLLLGIKLVVTILILSYIYKTFSNEQKGIGDIGEVFGSILNAEHLATILLILALVPVNWAFESLKWQKLVGKVIKLSFWEAFRGTLTGLAVGVAAPAQLGDTIGRIAALKSDRRLEAIGAALVSNGIQFYVSVVAGAWGWFQIQQRLLLAETSKQLLSLLLVLIIILGIATIWLKKPVTEWKPEKAFFKKIQSYIRIIGSYSSGEIGFATLLGAFRYLIFLSQFVLALSLFDLPVSVIDLISCVSLIFLAKTLIPAINVLGDLGLREFTALLVFASYDLPPERIIAATFLVWIVNVLGPILIGIFLIWKYKWKAVRMQEKRLR
ncbi:lysylphosphatidylglycerol synthase domain-containing protein [Dyadobacter sp. CY323]|uniref:lysylphosphatidylglycerol synthase domain-containing protein n=1 Tax=Dyadobacter sp. CY323 TaxID=2907302 RepID=UPI001F2F26FA|nr:lysylphosphatidylglycerol synthase domain-containing protein [Dyadobacter sp. CY323]MCE6987580.1 flippase-like domain-containing protein [Dyadobacter sp. CY323]